MFHLTPSSSTLYNFPDSWIIWPSNLVNTTTKGTVEMVFSTCQYPILLIVSRTYLWLFLYQRTLVLRAEWGEHCPWVYNTYTILYQILMQVLMCRYYQIACNCSLSWTAADLFLMKSQVTSNSSLAPDSKPWESWKIKLLPLYVIWFSISWMPLFWFDALLLHISSE